MNALDLLIDPLQAIDFYKAGHRQQYPAGTNMVYSNWTARKSRLLGVNSIVNIGLSQTLQIMFSLWDLKFFQQPKDEVVARYKRRMDKALGVDAIPVDHIEALHDLGYLPLKFKALPEGRWVPIGVPFMTVESTLPEFFWLVNYVETYLSAEMWKTITAATIAAVYRQKFNTFADLTCENRSFCPWQGHDFSMRGLSGVYDCTKVGPAHLASFFGTDTVPALDAVETYYGSDKFIGGSVPATEHSVMCMGGLEDEIGTFKRLITETYSTGVVSVVSDTWDFWKVLTEYLPALKDIILQRNGKLVIRPDSGDPVKIICGDGSAPIGSPAYKGSIQLLWEVFGGKINSKGFKELDPHIGLIYGDSITLERQRDILEQLMAAGFASNCVVLGIGSYTYQMQTRDTFGQAIKATYGEINNVPQMIFKDPVTDDGTKKSLKGKFKVTFNNELHRYVVEDSLISDDGTELVVVAEDSKLLVRPTFDEIRANIGVW